MSIRIACFLACAAIMVSPSVTWAQQSSGSDAAPSSSRNIVETAIDAGAFNTLVAAVKAAGLVETLSGAGPFTVFAPTDEAFANLPAGTVETLLKPENKAQLVSVLTYHVVPGRVPASAVVGLKGAKTVNGQRVNIASNDAGVTVDSANVVQTDIQCSNGIIHVVDSVLLPESGTIVDVASNTGSFGTLLAAANAAGLVPTLSGDGPLTVFAPTEEAFSALPKGTVASLLQPGNEGKLADILKYHVVAGRVYSEDALALTSAPTVAGPSIAITLTDGGANVNNARLLQTDIDASNGVIHVIDRVLLPSDAPSTSSVTSLKPTPDQRNAAKSVLNDAIHRGVAVFNAGHHGQCADIYMQALQAVSAMPDATMPASLRDQLNHTLITCPQMTNGSNRAWALRHQIDQLVNQW
ncbi:Immunogenic protein MPT70 precursor [Rubripirellula tenax]|uniref:Immunogenic protein MPT70 n=1 Tax=Rubripirellula tenax TaxID=2528015 RepID=A0A5C6EJY0_9BACT|nr:fasciclin domain-containing protein [Rubripirellula tenax]TWU48864.1 Immunogenic protein MPT70 precursor [Rubripirellula tenax]